MAQRRRDVLTKARPLALGLAAYLALEALPARAEEPEPPPPPPPPPASEAPAFETVAPETTATETVASEAAAAPVAILLPTSVREDGPARRGRVQDEALAESADRLDAILTDVIQELGFTLDLSDRMGGLPPFPTELDLLERARERGALIVAPRIEAEGQNRILRVLIAPPDSPVLRMRVARVSDEQLPVRAAVMLRDLTVGKGASPSPVEAPLVEAPPQLATAARSAGRATLALNAALFGAFVGYSVQRSSGSDDPRLLYPLMALGTATGLGASMIIAEEWDVGVGDAWFLSAGAWWPAAAGGLIAEGRGVSSSDRHAYALAGAGAGLGLATFALTFKGMGEGGALLTHSGGAFGTVLGGLTELAIEGSTDAGTPYTGMGYGAAAGVLVAGTLATQLQEHPSRVLGLDIGAGLGGLAGAALTSPFLFGERTEGRDRTFLVATMGGIAVGGTIGWLAAPSAGGEKSSSWKPTPVAGVVGSSQLGDGAVPIYGAGLRGELR